ncbi:MAG: hypothetical protein KDA65_04610 [Planctomycetaceae bacterium]|nr:hypothetical protein [Planctomycetaceae bacterium]
MSSSSSSSNSSSSSSSSSSSPSCGALIYHLPGSAANETAGAGDADWTNYNNIKEVGNGVATAAIGNNEITHYLAATNFPFCLPPGHKVDAIYVKYHAKSDDDTYVKSNGVNLTYNGETPVGLRKGANEVWPTSGNELTVGGDVETFWGISNFESWRVLVATFGVLIQGVNDERHENHSVEIDYVKVLIEHSESSSSSSDSSSSDSSSSWSSSSSNAAPEDEMACPCEGKDVSEKPIRYANGTTMYETTDVSAGGFGLGWAHNRVYSNRMAYDFNRGNGTNWYLEDWPYLIVSPNTTSAIGLMGNVNRPTWFVNQSGSYKALYGALTELTHDSGTATFSLLDTDGTKTVFHDFTHAERPGLMKSVTSPGGNTVEVTGGGSGYQDLFAEREFTSGGVTTYERFKYEFHTSGSQYGQLNICTLQRKK